MNMRIANREGGCLEVSYKQPGCLGRYNFEHIVRFAEMRYVEGYNTIDLMQQARSDTEREEVALVCMLDIKDDLVRNIQLNCRYARKCKVTNCRSILKRLIEAELKLNKFSH